MPTPIAFSSPPHSPAKAVALGFEHLQRHVTDGRLNEQGDIERLQLDDGDTLAADSFVNCAGFASLLISRALQLPFIPYAENLFNDAAIAMPTPLAGAIE